RDGSLGRQAVRRLSLGAQARALEEEGPQEGEARHDRDGGRARAQIRARDLSARRGEPGAALRVEASIAFAGTPEFAVPTLRALVASGARVPLVLTQPDR